MLPRVAIALVALFAMPALAGAGSSRTPWPWNDAPFKRYRGLDLPANTRCAVEIRRYAKIVYWDHRVGNRDPWDFDQIELDIANAAAACRAGHDAQARALVIASEHRYGYPSPL